MKQGKHRIVCGLIFFLLLFGSVLGQTVSIQPGSQNVDAGATATIDVRISGMGAFAAPSLGAFDILVCFNPAVLSYSDITFGSLLGDDAAMEVISGVIPLSQSVNAFQVSLLLPTELLSLQPADFTLFTLSFNALSDGMSPLEILLNAPLSDELGNPLNAGTLNGFVQVGEPPGAPILSLPPELLVDDQVFEVPVSLDTGTGVTGMQFTLDYDPLALRFLSIAPAELGVAHEVVHTTSPTGSVVGVIFSRNVAPLADGPGTLATVQFSALKAGTFDLTLGGVVASDTVASRVTVVATGGSVEIPEDVLILRLPTLTEWATIFLALLLGLSGFYSLRQRNTPAF